MSDPAAIDELFRTFRSSAWRLEVRTSYGADQPFEDFQAGRIPELAWFTPWLDLMREQIQASGKRVERVRVIDQPPSDYLRWEYWLNRYNAEVGEDIRYLPREVAVSLHLPAYDFWIFDDSRVAFMEFDAADAFLGPVIVADEAVTRQHQHYQAVAWKHAIPYESYRL